ncbi:hypothetical protein BDV96DRAFT_612048 [Lophiotrema nucula]|uniref:Uncharacterized protein n=1 Tax=Lophiotrema nucula TaxID=690887 RepID=A0A6A5ZDC3_9PLEO|nr:hypothetical protein BDV96DRAFT_612048 [Lophiotrema nucula]
MDDSESQKLAAALTGGEKCNDQAIKALRESFLEMNELFQAALKVNWTGLAEQEYFGRPERLMNYTNLVEDNIRRAAQYANLKGNPQRMPDIHIRCDDPYDVCDDGNKRDGNHLAYNIGNEPHINFCDRFFKLDPLAKAVGEASSNQTTMMDLMAYYNRATAWARQVMHIAPVGKAVVEKIDLAAGYNGSWTTVKTESSMNTSFLAGVSNDHPITFGPNNIQALKYGYGATRAKLIAGLSTQEPYDAVNNAESYSLYAQAKYVMEKRGYYPSIPTIPFANEMAILANEELQKGEKKRYACFDMPDVVPASPKTNMIGTPISSSASSIVKLRSALLEGHSGLLCLALSFSITLLASY